MKPTPLYAAHEKLNARIVDYAGWAMPVLYTGILEEARAVRNDVGMFDISHMGRIQLSGGGAITLLQSLTSNDVASLQTCEAQYSFLTNQYGGIIDDIIIYRESNDSFMVVINAGNADKDIRWIKKHMHKDATFIDNSDATAMIAVQGPRAPGLVAELANNPELLSLKRFAYANGMIAGTKATFCRTGYTGEDGYELIVPAERSEAVWNALLERGVAPCGLGARDALRIEAGYPLYGHEIDDSTSPVEAGLMWAVKLEKGEFIGRDAIQALKLKGPTRKLVGLISQERIQPRQGYTILSGSETIGLVTSGVFSPTRNRSVAMGYVTVPFAKTGTQVEVAIRDKHASAIVIPKKNLLTY